jgi:hypothetical protein
MVFMDTNIEPFIFLRNISVSSSKECWTSRFLKTCNTTLCGFPLPKEKLNPVADGKFCGSESTAITKDDGL